MKRRIATLLLAVLPILLVVDLHFAQTGEYVVRDSATPCLNFRPEPNTAADAARCIKGAYPMHKALFRA